MTTKNVKKIDGEKRTTTVVKLIEETVKTAEIVKTENARMTGSPRARHCRSRALGTRRRRK